jgi:uncharacterized protein YjbI with pentapeptide repeats
MKMDSKIDLQEILRLHKLWLENEDGGVGADLSRANLSGADLRGADLRGADLSRANLDFSCLPLWCGSLKMTVDRRLSAQIAYHFCNLRCDDPEVIELQKSLYKFANEFHRVQSGECPKLEIK